MIVFKKWKSQTEKNHRLETAVQDVQNNNVSELSRQGIYKNEQTSEVFTNSSSFKK